MQESHAPYRFSALSARRRDPHGGAQARPDRLPLYARAEIALDGRPVLPVSSHGAGEDQPAGSRLLPGFPCKGLRGYGRVRGRAGASLGETEGKRPWGGLGPLISNATGERNARLGTRDRSPAQPRRGLGAHRRRAGPAGGFFRPCPHGLPAQGPLAFLEGGSWSGGGFPRPADLWRDELGPCRRRLGLGEKAISANARASLTDRPSPTRPGSTRWRAQGGLRRRGPWPRAPPSAPSRRCRARNRPQRRGRDPFPWRRRRLGLSWTDWGGGGAPIGRERPCCCSRPGPAPRARRLGGRALGACTATDLLVQLRGKKNRPAAVLLDRRAESAG